jgi:hypothetical protein
MSTGRQFGHCAASCCLTAICTFAIFVASSAAEPPSDATSSKVARQEAIRAIPWQQLTPIEQQNVQAVVKNATIYRRLPTRVIDCDPDLFTFLLQHPDVVVDVWRIMGVSSVTLDRIDAQTFHGSDGAGTTGDIRYHYASWGPNARNLAVIYADGAYDGKPFTTPLRAQSVLIMRSAAVQETNGRHYITVRLDSFIRVEQKGVDIIARTIQPWINKTADRNLIETLGFVSTFSRTAERNPQGMQRLAARLQRIDEPTRDELVNLCFRTAQRYTSADEPSWMKPYVLAQQVELTETR